MPMTVLGAGLLWFGWFGFNAGSAVAANGLAANAFVVTNTAAAAATITWVLASYLRKRKVSVVGAACGAVAGLVAITPASGFVGVGGALVIGLVAGGLCYSATLLRERLKVDDALDVFAVHGVGGMFGAVATGVFATAAIQPAYTGLLEGNPQQLVNQLIAVGATIAVRRHRHLRDRQGRRPRPRHPGHARSRRRWVSTCPSTARPPTSPDAGRAPVGTGSSRVPTGHRSDVDHRPSRGRCRPPRQRLLRRLRRSRRWTIASVTQPLPPPTDARRSTTRATSTMPAASGSSRTRAGGRATGSCRWPWPVWPRSPIAARSAPTASRATAPASRSRSTGPSCAWLAGSRSRRRRDPRSSWLFLPRGRAAERAARALVATTSSPQPGCRSRPGGRSRSIRRRSAPRRRHRARPCRPGHRRRVPSGPRRPAAALRRGVRAPAGRRPASARDRRPRRRRPLGRAVRPVRVGARPSSTRASSPAAAWPSSTPTCARRCRSATRSSTSATRRTRTPIWRLAQPFRSIAHNGEINTVRGNREQVRGRARRHPARGRSPPSCCAAGPLLSPDGSDSLSLDEGLELLTTTGWDLDAGPARGHPRGAGAAPRPASRTSPTLRRRTAGLLAPWDGPAAIVFADGRRVGALIDRNGLRPAAFAVTRDRLVAVASEAGAVPFAGRRDDPSRPPRAGRAAPRRAGPPGASSRTPTPRPGSLRSLPIHDAPRPTPRGHGRGRGAGHRARAALEHRVRYLVGLDAERARLDIKTMALEAHEPLWSMGDDTPTAGRARLDRPVADHLRQAFAQVTNPAIDPERERIVMDLRVELGRRPAAARRPAARSAHAAPRAPDRGRPRRAARRRSRTGRPADPDARCDVAGRRPGPAGSSAALDRLARAAVAAGRGGHRGPRRQRRGPVARPAARAVHPRRRRRPHGPDRRRPARPDRLVVTPPTSSTSMPWPWSSPSARRPPTRGWPSSSPPSWPARAAPRSSTPAGAIAQPRRRVRGRPAQDPGPDGHQRRRELHRRRAHRHRRPRPGRRRALLPDGRGVARPDDPGRPRRRGSSVVARPPLALPPTAGRPRAAPARSRLRPLPRRRRGAPLLAGHRRGDPGPVRLAAGRRRSTSPPASTAPSPATARRSRGRGRAVRAARRAARPSARRPDRRSTRSRTRAPSPAASSCRR